MTTDDTSPPSFVTRHYSRRRAVLLIIWLAVILTGILFLRNVLTLETLADQEAALRERLTRQPLLVYGGAFLAYVAVTGLSLPGATALTLAYGWFFGFLRGVVLVSFASTTGATLAFLLSRYLFREAVERRFPERFASFNDALRRDGPFFLFALRLVFVVPFFVINLVMGLTPIRTCTFWWVSQLGMLPATAVYVYAGSSVPSLQTLAERGAGAAFAEGRLAQLLFALALLGLFPLVIRLALRHLGVSPAPPRDAHEEE